MTPAETAAHLVTARRALTAAESAHAEAIAAEVRASVPGPWVAQPQAGAIIERDGVTVGLSWGPSGWTVWAASYAMEWFRSGTPPDATTPREALQWLRGVLNRCRGETGHRALALVVRLLRGWDPTRCPRQDCEECGP